MSESSASALVRRFTEDVWNGRQLDLLDDLADDAYKLRNLSDDSVPVRTRVELRTHIEEWLAAFPDLHMHETDQGHVSFRWSESREPTPARRSGDCGRSAPRSTCHSSRCLTAPRGA